ncbi:sugar ABC transporter permease [Mobilitalea sibirica]|uniref:Sugar ABC transporter permease n=1 Tax=Mobilitalea sibirica TaxID=1462919 RepID=A0A8J7GZ93_9FIRM|nr:sugar ABC transporter permease [Mobilitalea sibirica]MBH1941139.1 sugar ABC transporter permease [Mobilitalea sibirica]
MKKEKKHKKPKSMAYRNAVTGYLFTLPFIIGFIMFLLVPMFQSLRMAFSDVVFQDGITYDFIGLDNFKYAFTVDPDFYPNMIAELIQMAYSVPSIIIFSFFIAIVLNQQFKGRGLVRAIFFLPVILSSGVLVGLETNNSLMAGLKDVIAETSNLTSITDTVKKMILPEGVTIGPIMYVFDAVDQVYDIAIASGIQIIIFLSGLQTISPSMFEAAKIEGATAWETFWKITFPMISSLILVNVIYSIIDFFLKTDNEVMDLIKQTMVSKVEYGLSSAMAWTYFAVVAVIIGVVSAIISKKVYYYE